MAETDKEFDHDFKMTAVERVWACGSSARVAREMGISEETLGSWVRSDWAQQWYRRVVAQKQAAREAEELPHTYSWHEDVS